MVCFECYDDDDEDDDDEGRRRRHVKSRRERKDVAKRRVEQDDDNEDDEYDLHTVKVKSKRGRRGRASADVSLSQVATSRVVLRSLGPLPGF